MSDRIRNILMNYSNHNFNVNSRVVLTEKILPPLINLETTKLESITWRQTRHNCNWEDFIDDRYV